MRPSYSLADSYAKIARADEQLRGLHDEIKHFIQRLPYTFHVEPDRDPPKQGANIYRVRCSDPVLVEERMTRFGILAGEVCHLLRSSLNHLVWNLIRKNGGRTTTKTEFPIFISRDGYAERAAAKIRGVPQESEAVFETMQPYRGSGKTDPLWLLHDLNVRDKHHVLLVTVGVLPVRIESAESFTDEFYPLADGAIVKGLWTRESVGTQAANPIAVALAEPMINQTLVECLLDCLETTEDTVREFQQFF